jgi:hypothetical protein
MEDLYQEESYPDEYYYEPEPRSGTSGWVIALIVIAALLLVCCICFFLTVAGVAVLSPALEGTFSTG